MNNVIKELLLMRKCMTNDYYISVKNKTNCFLNSCKKKTQSYKTNVFHLFQLSSTLILLCHIYNVCMYVYSIYCIWVFPIRFECQEMNGLSVVCTIHTYIFKERKKPVRMVSIGLFDRPLPDVGLSPELASFRVHIQFLHGS